MANRNPLPTFPPTQKKRVTFNLAANTTRFVDTRCTQPASPPHEIEYNPEDDLRGNFLDTLEQVDPEDRGTNTQIAVNLAPLRFQQSRDPDEKVQAILAAAENARWNAIVALGHDGFDRTEVEVALQRAVEDTNYVAGPTDAGPAADNARDMDLLEVVTLMLEKKRESLFSKKYKDAMARYKAEAATKRKNPQTLKEMIALTRRKTEAERASDRVLVERELVERLIRDRELFGRKKGPQFHPLRKVEVEPPTTWKPPIRPLEKPPTKQQWATRNRRSTKELSEEDQLEFDNIMAGKYNVESEAGGDEEGVSGPPEPAPSSKSPGEKVSPYRYNPTAEDDISENDSPKKPGASTGSVHEEISPREKLPPRKRFPPSEYPQPHHEDVPRPPHYALRPPRKAPRPPKYAPRPPEKVPRPPEDAPRPPENENEFPETNTKPEDDQSSGISPKVNLPPEDLPLSPSPEDPERSRSKYRPPAFEDDLDEEESFRSGSFRGHGFWGNTSTEAGSTESTDSLESANDRDWSTQRVDPRDYHLPLKPNFFKRRLENLFPEPLSLPQSKITRIGNMFNAMVDKENAKNPSWTGLNMDAHDFLGWFFQPILQLQSFLALELKVPVGVSVLISVLVAAGSIYWHHDDTVDVLFGKRRRDPFPRASARLNDRLGGL